MGKVTPYGHERSYTRPIRQAQIHQSNIGLMDLKLLEGFLRIRGLGDQQHIPLGADDRGQPFAENGVVFHAQYANWSRGIQG